MRSKIKFSFYRKFHYYFSIIGISLIMLSSKCSLAQVKKISAESTIQNVTIYSSGARIERTSTVSIASGRSEITFSGLSNQLDQQSVQLQADANITLLSVQASKDFLNARKMEQDERNFTDKINSLDEKISQDNKQLEVLKNEEQMLIKNQEIGGQTGVKTPELKIALDFQKQRFTEVYEQEIIIQKRITEEKKELQGFNSQRSVISKKKDSINYMVTALIESKGIKTIKFQLLYNITDAGWYPTYDVRLADVTQPLKILMNANVFQRSGETWKDVDLMLSSGSPNDNATPSQLLPWMLNFYDPSVSVRSITLRGTITGRISNEKGEPVENASITIKGSKLGTTSDANGFFKLQNFNPGDNIIISSVGYDQKIISARAGYYSVVLSASTQYLNEVVVTGYGVGVNGDINQDLQGAVKGVIIDRFKSIQTINAATQYQPTTTVYKIDDKYSIETDSKTTTIGIKEFDMPAVYEYLTIPKIDPNAFLNAKIINWQDYDLQSGEASLYYEGSYLGKTYIDLSSTTDTLSLSLGKDNGIKVSRKLIREYSTKKFLGSNKTESRQYEISVKNNKKIPVTIMIYDQIPISTNKEISVEEVKIPDAQLDKGTGVANWALILLPGQERRLLIGYNVKYPKDKTIVLE